MLKGTIKAEIVYAEKMRGMKSLQREEEIVGITALHLGREQNLSVLMGKLKSHFMPYTCLSKSTKCKLSQ